MAIYIYRSTDTDAPVLSNTAGTLLTVLDACLVNGYGEKTALGWTIEQTDTNLRTYRAATGNRRYFAVDDTTTTYARARMFDTVTAAGVAITSGTNPCPTDTQQSGGIYWNKVGGSNRKWVLISNGVLFYFLTDYNDSNNTWVACCFGDFPSYNTNDIGNTIIVGLSNTSSGGQLQNYVTDLSAVVSNHYISTRYDYKITSTACGKAPINGYFCDTVTSGAIVNWIFYPEPLTGRLLITPLSIIEKHISGDNYGVKRGRLSGLWHYGFNYSSFTSGDTISGAVDSSIEGRTFEFFNIGGAGILIETSDTWDSVNFY